MINDADRNFVQQQEGAGEGLLHLVLARTKGKSVPSGFWSFLLDMKFWYTVIRAIGEYLVERAKNGNYTLNPISDEKTFQEY